MQIKSPKGWNSQPVDAIATWLQGAGFNCVRLTYSMDMALDPDQLVSESFRAAADFTGLLPEVMAVFGNAVTHNPWLATAGTRETFASVISTLGDHNIMVVLDNHNSHASWCCSLVDGNGWWDTAVGYNASNSRYFNTENWLKGLADMANFSTGFIMSSVCPSAMSSALVMLVRTRKIVPTQNGTNTFPLVRLPCMLEIRMH